MGPEEVVLIETKPSSNSSQSSYTFGLNPVVSRKQVSMAQFLQVEQRKTHESSYLNIQQRHLGKGKFRSPLHLLQEDISPNIPLLESFWNSNITDVNLWLGGCSSEDESKRLLFHSDFPFFPFFSGWGTDCFSISQSQYILILKG